MAGAAAKDITMVTVESQRAGIISSFVTTKDGIQAKGTDEKHIQYINQLITSQDRVKQMGEQPATIVSLNPYPLIVNGPLFDGLKVLPVPDGKAYSALVIRDVKYEVNTGLDHAHSPVEFWPIQIAQEFENQYRDKGGVFIIRGNLEKNPELAHTADFNTKFEAAFEELIQYAFRMKTAADVEWARPNRSGRSNVHAQHRIMVRLLYKSKRIPKLPEWEDVLISPEDIIAECPACKSELKKGAYMCGTCGRISDPAAAFRDGAIKETDQSLERLTRAEVEELGVGAFVAETADEAKERRSKGLAKPLSIFERNQIAAQEREHAATAKKGKE